MDGNSTSLIGVFLILLVIFWLANLAEKRRTQGSPYAGLAFVAYLLLTALLITLFFIGLGLQVVSRQLAAQPEQAATLGIPPEFIDLMQSADSMTLLSVGIWLPALLGIFLLLPPVRRLAARVLAIDPRSPVHAVALSLTALVFISLFSTLGVGLGNLSEQFAQLEEGEQSPDVISFAWLQTLLFVILGMVGVGWLSRRNLAETLDRLGIVVPTPRQIGLGVGLALVLVPAGLVVEYVGSLLGVGNNPDVEELTEQLIGPLFRSPFGIFTVGLSAALGEETLMRGAVQPRFGLIFTTLLFALLHNNYGFSTSTAVVFGIGLILGWVRIRHNTTTAMIVHAVYNSTLGLLAYLGMIYGSS